MVEVILAPRHSLDMCVTTYRADLVLTELNKDNLKSGDYIAMEVSYLMNL